MEFNNDLLFDNDVVANESSFLKKHKNILITQDQIYILKKYNININKYNNFAELIYDIEEYLNGSGEALDDLEWVSQSLAEFNYYNNTNK